MAQGTTNLVHKDTGDGTIVIFPWAYSSITAGTWVASVSASYNFNGFYYNSSNAINDQIDYKAYLTKGVWSTTLIVPNVGNMGKVHLLLDSDTQSVLEPHTIGSLVIGFPNALYVPTTGLHTLSFLCKMGYGGYSYFYSQFIVLKRAN